MATHWTQDWPWFNDKWDKETVKCLIRYMCKLTKIGIWKWPSDLLTGTRMIRQQFNSNKGKQFTTDEVTSGINKLFERHCVFSWLRSKKSFTWNRSTNRFIAEDAEWSKAIEVSLL